VNRFELARGVSYAAIVVMFVAQALGWHL